MMFVARVARVGLAVGAVFIAAIYACGADTGLAVPASQPANSDRSINAVAYGQISPTDKAAVLDYWRATAERTGIPPLAISRGAAFLSIGLEKVRLARPFKLTECQQAIQEFLKINKTALTTKGPVPDGQTGASYWMAFCICDWLARPELGEMEQVHLEDKYKTFAAQLTQKLKAELLAAQDPSELANARDIIDSACVRLTDSLDASTKGLVQDSLYPAFKREIETNKTAATSDEILSSAKPPKFGEVDKMLETPEEAFRRHINAYIATISVAYGVNISETQLDASLSHSQYWGDMLVAGESQNGPWPMVYFLRRP